MNRRVLSAIIKAPTTKLAGTYLVIMMLMSISFSIVFYDASTRQINRPIPPNSQTLQNSRMENEPFDEEVRKAIEVRFRQAREDLMTRLVWINIAILVAGGTISYVLARRSLRPIEQAMDAQNQFVSDASHELRTPLTVLQTTNEVALRKKDLNLKGFRDLTSRNVEEVKKLRMLSDSLLSLLRNSDQELILDNFELQDVLNEALQHVVSIAQQKDIAIEDLVPKISVHTNESMLARLIVILLDNAVKYSGNGSKVSLRAKKVDGKVYMSVTDQGIGIKASDLPHIFRRFYRADKSRTVNDAPGYGLGLSIAEKIAKQLHVRLKVESEIGEGSTFTVVIPGGR